MTATGLIYQLNSLIKQDVKVVVEKDGKCYDIKSIDKSSLNSWFGKKIKIKI